VVHGLSRSKTGTTSGGGGGGHTIASKQRHDQYAPGWDGSVHYSMVTIC
jgi:hypothetical protein